MLKVFDFDIPHVIEHHYHVLNLKNKKDDIYFCLNYSYIQCNQKSQSLKKIGQIKEQIGRYVLHKKVKNIQRNVKVCNIDDAQSIGILFNATFPLNFDIIKNFAKELETKKSKVTALGYVNNKVLIDHYLYRKGFEFFTHNDLNWYHEPKSEAVHAFIETEFDILINLSLERYLPLDFVLALSKAKFKTGKYFDQYAFMDLMIDTHKEMETLNEIRTQVKKTTNHRNPDNTIEIDMDARTNEEVQLNFLIKQMVHYLSALKAS